MNKKLLRIIVSLLLAMCMTLFACGRPDNNHSGKEDNGTVELWGAYSTEKIMQNDTESYSDIKKPAEINLKVIGGEEEACQIIMTTSDKSVKYDVKTSDLKDANGNVLSEDKIKVYHQRYVELPAPSEYYKTPGFYPDCIVPFENVKRLNENIIKENNNQGLYISFEIPENQASGIYTGKINITAGKTDKDIPVTIDVANVSIGKETHTKSVFLNQWTFVRGEKDSTPEMYEAYNQALFDRRIGCDIVTTYVEDVDYYAEKVCEYAKQDSCPNYSIPWFSTNYKNSGYVLNGRELKAEYSYNADKLIEYFVKIAKKGIEQNVDPFKKAVIYGSDEPDLNWGTVKATIYVKEWSYIVKQTKINASEILKADKTITNKELLEQILTSLEKIPHLILSSTFLNFEYVPEEEDIVYCPEFQFVQNKGAQDQYRLTPDNELWWYGCVNPSYPYPTYHIADTLVSARIEAWMKADYNIQGNLYWATNAWSQPSGSSEVVVFPEDYYGKDVVGTGEGVLFYPGARYGIYGPLSSMRLEQIRDGLEEYEMIYKLSEIYKKKASELSENFDEKSIMKYLYDSMYSGTMVGTTSENFENNRKKLITLLEMASSDANIVIKNVTMGAGTYTFDIFANDGTTLKQANREINPSSSVTGGNIYSVEVKPGVENALSLSAEKGENTYSFELLLGKESRTFDAEYMYENGSITSRKGGMNIETVLVDAKTVNPDAGENEKYLQLLLADSVKVTQDFLIVDSEAISKIDKTDNKLSIRLYNADKEKVLVRVYFEYNSDPGKFSSYANIYVYPGLDNVTITNISELDWNKNGGIKSIRIMVGDKGDKARNNLYFSDMTIFK